MGRLFIDASFGVCRMMYWPTRDAKPTVLAPTIGPSLPLSTVLNQLWQELARFKTVPELISSTSEIYVLRGPGSLITLRVLFSHLVGLWATAPHIVFKGLSTPVWYTHVFRKLGFSIFASFVFQVGRLAYIAGQPEKPESYRTWHMHHSDEWHTLRQTLVPPVLWISFQKPDPIKDFSPMWVEGSHTVLPGIVASTLFEFPTLSVPQELKPIEAV